MVHIQVVENRPIKDRTGWRKVLEMTIHKEDINNIPEQFTITRLWVRMSLAATVVIEFIGYKLLLS